MTNQFPKNIWIEDLHEYANGKRLQVVCNPLDQESDTILGEYVFVRAIRVKATVIKSLEVLQAPNSTFEVIE